MNKIPWEKNLRHLRNLWDFFHSQGVSFLRGIIFVPQISQIYTDFLWNLWWISLSDPRGYLQRPDRSPPRNSVSNRRSRKSPNKFRVIRWWKKICVICEICVTKNVPQKSVYICEICGTFSNLWGICNDRTGRICEIPWVIATAGNLRINSVSSDEKIQNKNPRDKKIIKNDAR